MKTAIAVWGFTLFIMGLGLFIGIQDNPTVGFGLFVFGALIPFSYEPIRKLFK